MVLFRNRIFNLALAISIAWHLFWICGIRVDFGQFSTSSLKKYPAISFLGSILEESTFRTGLKLDLFKFGGRRGLIGDSLDLRSRFSGGGVELNRKKEIITRKQAGVLNKCKLVDLSSTLGEYSLTPPDYLPRVKLEGPVKDRMVLYNPPFPSLPDWASQHSLKFNLQIKFWVSHQGIVRRTEPKISCGYPELDLLGMRYINKWRFESLPADYGQIGQWGVAKISLK
ncbi:MAG: hypothetical protein U9R31_00960 [Candidatus Omnitrophota bacterium]|nr:hypothetical protein [Candidatus Omnitrophota bacterium]